jgi:hypothetical protein
MMTIAFVIGGGGPVISVGVKLGYQIRHYKEGNTIFITTIRSYEAAHRVNITYDPTITDIEIERGF